METNIHRDHNFIFIHIPKTGGTSVRRTLGLSGLGRHATWADFHALLGQKYERMYKFGFVRNPWDRFLSMYNYIRMDENYYHSATDPDSAIYGKHRLYDLLTQCSLNDAVHYLIEGRFRNYSDGFFLFAPQCEWVCDQNGNSRVDYIGRFEALGKDFTTVCDHIGYTTPELPHINQSAGAETSYRNAYDPESRHLIGVYYEQDIDLFKYTF